MNQKKIIERVAAGLRRMGKKPDYLLFLKFHIKDESVYDNEKICGIKVIHTDECLSRNDERDCPFYPLWDSEGNYDMDVYYFRRGYDES